MPSATGLEVKFFAVGRKALDHFRRTGQTIAGERINNTRAWPPSDWPSDLRITDARRLSRRRRSCETGLVYSHFHSALSQRPTYERLLPVANPKPEQGAGDDCRPGSTTWSSRAAPSWCRSCCAATSRTAIFHALLEAEASEQGARMTAMDSATNNAADMIAAADAGDEPRAPGHDHPELMDIVGGAEALRG